jgi:hypothetical protein
VFSLIKQFKICPNPKFHENFYNGSTIFENRADLQGTSKKFKFLDFGKKKITVPLCFAYPGPSFSLRKGPKFSVTKKIYEELKNLLSEINKNQLLI